MEAESLRHTITWSHRHEDTTKQTQVPTEACTHLLVHAHAEHAGHMTLHACAPLIANEAETHAEAGRCMRSLRPHLKPFNMLGNEPHKNSRNHIDASHSRQPLVKGERLVRYEVNAVIPLPRLVARRVQLRHVFQCAMFPGMYICGRVGSGSEATLCSFLFSLYNVPRHAKCVGEWKASAKPRSAPFRCSPANLQNIPDDLTRFSHAGG